MSVPAHLQDPLNDHDQALLAALSQWGGEEAQDILKKLSQSRSKALQGPLEALLKTQGSTEKPAGAPLDLAGESLFFHADPGWISEIFQDESPAALALLLEGLPKAKIGGVLRNLSKETRRALKKVKSDKVSKSIREQILKKAQSKFPRFNPRQIKEDPVFSRISGLNSSQLAKLLKEIGLGEMALAFSRVSRSSVRVILNRLRPPEAKELRRRLKEGGKMSPQDQREAQLHILSLDFEKIGPEDILKEIGLGVLSRTLVGGPSGITTYFIYKFPPKIGYLLKRQLDQNTQDQNAEKRNRVLKRLEQALKELIDEA